jgi:hypothetical protein
VKEAEEIQKFVESTQVGGNLQIELRRNQKDLNITVQPGAVPVEKQ